MVKLHNEMMLERCQISPPPGSVVAPPPLPLTVFDLHFYPLKTPVRRVFFYKLSDITFSTFLESHLPNLKHSLALALQRFYPLAGRLVPAPGGAVPSLLCYKDGDWVELTIAERYDDFGSLIQDGPKDASMFHALAPLTLLPDGRGQPVLALKVTLFPVGLGVAVGVSVHHGAVDGYSSIHFIKTWASFCRGKDGGDIERPLFDRSVIVDPVGLGKTFLAALEEQYRHDVTDGGGEEPDANNDCNPDTVFATFRLSEAQLEGLRSQVTAKEHGLLARFSSFSLATALVWISLVKTRRRGRNAASVDSLLFAFGVRGRFTDAVVVPQGYFGNCVGSCLVKARSMELLGGEGLAAAAIAVRDAVQRLNPNDVIRDMEPVGKFLRESLRSGAGAENLMRVAGSPRLGVYRVDLGWGRPEKVELVSIATSGAMSLAEGKEEGSLEMGLALPKSEMEEFVAKLADGLRICAPCLE